MSDDDGAIIGGNAECDNLEMLLVRWSHQQMNQEERHLNPREIEILVACPVSESDWKSSFNNVKPFSP